MKVVLLSGGGGGARFARGLSGILESGELTVIGNVGDDVEILGLHVSPDLDSLMYTLAGLIDRSADGVAPPRRGMRSRQPRRGEERTGSGSAIAISASTSYGAAPCARARFCPL